ncbi:hypothetical protein [Arcticibacter tournemirensis]
MIELLNKLSAEELNLSIKVKALKGSMKGRQDYLANSGIIQKYRAIYMTYNDVFKRTQNLEVLKRIIFFQWYSVSEPLALTGIGELDDTLIRSNFAVLHDLILRQMPDNEFDGMILHYYSISDWYFNSFLNFTSLINMVLTRHNITKLGSFENRGLMGEYWNSLNLKEI